MSELRMLQESLKTKVKKWFHSNDHNNSNYCSNNNGTGNGRSFLRNFLCSGS